MDHIDLPNRNRIGGAPLPAEALRDAVAPFGASRTLPSAAYTSPAVFEWERRWFFEDGWICAGRSADLAGEGERRAVQVGRDSILLVRSASTLRGFYNVCRHRGHELLPSGDRSDGAVVKCPYHSWVYGLDGRLRAAPHFAGAAGFELTDHALVDARIDHWHGWVFVDASGEAPPLSAHIGDLDDLVAPCEPERLVTAGRCDYTLAANWKLVIENYHECYHCPTIHPDLCRLSAPDSGGTYEGRGDWVGGYMDLNERATTMSTDGTSRGVPLRGLDRERRRRVDYVDLFPNLLISAHPDYVMTHRIEPVDERTTRVECDWLFPPEAFDRPGFDPSYAIDFWDVTNRQDWAACEGVQRGMSSRGFRPGVLGPEEPSLYRFVSSVARRYLDGSR